MLDTGARQSRMNSFDIFGNPLMKRKVSSSRRRQPRIFEINPPSEVDQDLENEEPKERTFLGLWLTLTILFLSLSIQCFRLQITQNQTNRSLSESNSIKYTSVRAERGLILDSNGQPLAQNSRQEALVINPQTLPTKKADRNKVYQLLQKKANISNETITFIENNRLATPESFVIRQELSKDESLLYKEAFAETPGVQIIEIPIRLYSSLPSLGQLLGYVGVVNEEDVKNGYTPDQFIGKNGLEQYYNDILTGKNGRIKAEVNAYGEIVRYLPNSLEEKSKTGQTIKLAIDSNLQKIVYNALQNELARRTKRLGEMKEYGASAVVVDVNTGAIKAMVSVPDFDDNLFAKGIKANEYKDLLDNPANPLLNRAIQGSYPPGSTIKPLIAAAALQEGVITANTTMNTPDAITIGEFRFPDWKVHGQTNTRKAIAESNDIFFYAVGGGWSERNFKGLGMDRMNSYLSKFGLGQKLNLDLYGESRGLLPNNQWKKDTYNESWYIGDTYHSSIGQGFTLATPLQMAVGTAAIANGGTTYQPHLAYSLIDPVTNKEEIIAPITLNGGFVSSGNIQIVREGMRMTVESGSARPLNSLKVASAGKTGTAEFGNKGQMHAWYTGFAPYEKPEFAFSIMIEAGGDSYQSSVPVAEEILRNYFNDPLQPGQKLNSEPSLTGSEFHGEH